MKQISMRTVLALFLSFAMAATSFAAREKTPDTSRNRKSRGSSSNVRPEATSSQGGSSQTGNLDYDSPRGSYEDQGGFSGGFDVDAGPLGLFKAATTINMAAFSQLRNFVGALSAEEQAQLRAILTAGAASAAIVVGARVLLSAGAVARGLTLAGVLVTATATASAGDMIFDDSAYRKDPSLFLVTQGISTEDLALWAQAYQLDGELNKLLLSAGDVLCGDRVGVGAEAFCSSLQ